MKEAASVTPTRTNIFVRLAIVAVAAFFCISIINLRSELDALNEEKLLLEQQISDINDSIEEIQLRLETPLTLDYIEKVARELYDYRDSDEIIFYNNIAD